MKLVKLLGVLLTTLVLFGCNNDLDGYKTYYPFHRDAEWLPYKAGENITLHIKVIPEKNAVHILWDGFNNSAYMEWRIWSENKSAVENYLHPNSECEIKDSSNVLCSEIIGGEKYYFELKDGKIIQSKMITRAGTEYTYTDNHFKYLISKNFGIGLKSID